jgi:hypothetical protein
MASRYWLQEDFMSVSNAIWPVRNTSDMIDSRDVIARIEELEPIAAGEAEGYSCDEQLEAGRELRALRELASEAEGYSSEWNDGATLIRDSYFENYARQYADDIGAINADASWPNDCIDWERAARELRMDYTAVEFDGVTYWVRS